MIIDFSGRKKEKKKKKRGKTERGKKRKLDTINLIIQTFCTHGDLTFVDSSTSIPSLLFGRDIDPCANPTSRDSTFADHLEERREAYESPEKIVPID